LRQAQAAIDQHDMMTFAAAHLFAVVKAAWIAGF
jgi:hypothetical protein